MILRRVLLVSLSVVVFSSLLGKANAMCKQFSETCRLPVPVNQSYDWGAVNGLVNQAGKNIAYQVNVPGYRSVSASFGYANGMDITTVSLTDALLQLSQTDFNGQAAFRLYVQYTPTSDSGTFIISTTGPLLSGDRGKLNRLRSEIESANSDVF